MRQAKLEEIEALDYSEPFMDGRLQLFFVPKADEFMEAAFTVRHESTDKRHSTGAVVVQDGKILSMESNQSGFKHQALIRMHEKGLCVRKLLHVPSGKGYGLCLGCAKSHDHAESRAARAAAHKYPDKAKGATLYLAGHWWACKPCCNAMIEAGITKVILEEGAKAQYGRR